MPRPEDVLFARIAVKNALVEQAQVQECLRIVKEGGDQETLGDVLVESGYLSRERRDQVARAVDQYLAKDNNVQKIAEITATTQREGTTRKKQRMLLLYAGVAALCLFGGIFAVVGTMERGEGDRMEAADSPPVLTSAAPDVTTSRIDFTGEQKNAARAGRQPSGGATNPRGQDTRPVRQRSFKPASLSIAFVDEGQEPWPGLAVALLHGTRSILEEQTDQAGIISASGLAPGNYAIQVEGEEAGRLVSAKAVTLAPDEDKELTITIGTFDSAISGRVLDGGGEPLPGIIVRGQKSKPHAAEGALVRMDLDTHDFESNEKGEYIVSGLDQAEYVIFTEPTEDYPTVSKVAMAGLESVDLILYREHVLEVFGSVTSDDGDPVPGAKVVTRGRGTTSDKKGRYSIEVKLTEAIPTYYVSATHPGYRMEPLTLRLADVWEDESFHADLVLESIGGFASVEGFITSIDGDPVSGERVFLSSKTLRNGYGAVSGEDGRFQIDDVELADDYRVIVQPEKGYEDYSLSSVAISEDDTPTLEIVLEPLESGILRGTMVDPAGNAVPGFTLRMRHERAQRNVMNVTGDAEGYFVVESVPAGKLILETISAPQLKIHGTTLEPESDEELQLVLDWGQHTVSGTVVDAADTPVSGVEVSMSWTHKSDGLESFSMRRTTTDSEGRFIFSALASGPHRISVAALPGLKPAVVTYEVGDEGPEPVLKLISKAP